MDPNSLTEVSIRYCIARTQWIYQAIGINSSVAYNYSLTRGPLKTQSCTSLFSCTRLHWLISLDIKNKKGPSMVSPNIRLKDTNNRTIPLGSLSQIFQVYTPDGCLWLVFEVQGFFYLADSSHDSLFCSCIFVQCHQNVWTLLRAWLRSIHYRLDFIDDDTATFTWKIIGHL